MNTRNEIACLLRDLDEQATRHKRACGLKRFLVTDLEIIERKVEQLRLLMPPCVTPTGLTDAHGTYIKRATVDGRKCTVCTFCGEPVDFQIGESK